MIRRFHALIAASAFVAFTGVATAQERVDNPKLRAALHELRDARSALQEARDDWPAGFKEMALTHTQEAINTVKTILAVKDVNTFRGVERTPDYYKRYADHPKLRAALESLREARDELRASKAPTPEAVELKARGLDDIDVAVGSIIILIRHNPKK